MLLSEPAVLVDSHCHLNLMDYAQLGCDMDEVVARAGRDGVRYMLCVSVDLTAGAQVIAAAERYGNVFASVGVHPNHVVEHEPTADSLSAAVAGHPKVVAIGETGLDYYRNQVAVETQHTRFREHIAAAKRLRLPLIIHCRDAKQDVLRILTEERADEVGGVMHCFVEDWDTARAALDLNFVISFSGIVTFKSAQNLREVAKRIPDDGFLVETDSPYLAPVPFRGKVNQPAYTRQVALELAALRGVTFETIAEQSTANFFRVFHHARPALSSMKSS